MKKKGIVIDIKGEYLEVFPLENMECNLTEKKLSEKNEIHNCSNCSMCSPISQRSSKSIKIFNKSKRKVKIGEKITYTINFIALQFFIVVLLPFFAFGSTFSILRVYSCKEEICILFSFLAFFSILGLNFVLTKKLLKKIFAPFV